MDVETPSLKPIAPLNIRSTLLLFNNNFRSKKIERTCALSAPPCINRLQIGIDNVKKFQPIGGSLASVLMLLTLSAMLTLVTTWHEPILAQSAPIDPNAPTDTPIPVRVDDRNNNRLWWLLILIPVGGLVWAVSRSRRQNPETDIAATQPLVPNIPASSVDPVMLDGRAPQSDLADVNSLFERDRQHASGLVERDPMTIQSATGVTHPASDRGRDRDPQVTTPLAAPVTVDARSTQSMLVGEETARVQLVPVPEPDRGLTEHVRLLQERLVIDRHKRKVGEVIVRKEIETRFVRVPIRREILIVEQVDPEFKQLAVIDLGQIHDDATEIDPSTGSSPTIEASFTSPTAAIEFLKYLADRSPSGTQDLHLNIAIEDADTQAFYRQWLEQRSVEFN